jgi:glycine/D-amino acid oxidase-like deaminating enzyme
MIAVGRNYWTDSASFPATTPGPPPARADVVIVGAGFTGLSTAYELASRGARVVVLEARTIGGGASSRNGGMVLPGLKIATSALRARYGLAVAQRMYGAALGSVEHTAALIRTHDIQCDFARCGHLEVACTHRQYARYSVLADELARDFGTRIRIIPPNELAGEIGSRAYAGGIVDDRSGGLHPARYVAGLAHTAMMAGAQIYAHAPVTRIARTSRDGARGYEITSGQHRIVHRIVAPDVVIATGAYTDAAVPALRRRIIPIGSFIIATEPLADALARALSPRNRMIFDSRHFLHYYRLTPDNRMLFGGRAAFFPATHRTIARSAAILQRDLVSVFPQLATTRVDYAWGGTLDFCFDTMPHIARLGGMFAAAGFAGHGVAMATYAGAVMAAELRGEPVDNPFAGIPFRGAPPGLHSAVKWGLPLVAAWYKLQDWAAG